MSLFPVKPAAAPDASATPTDGLEARTFGDYELLEEIGEGGMGVVFKARQLSLNRLVALKMIRSGLVASEAEILRFLAEAEVVASLDHPNVVPIYEARELDGQRYFAMKLIEGGSLAMRRAEFATSPRLAAALIAKVARAVEHAHQRGILHRDLKPANILLDDQGQPHVTDFGLAKRVRDPSDLGQVNSVVGTPGYMAPEQVSGSDSQVTTAVDVYSLGAVLYELLGGRPPFAGPTPRATLRQVVEAQPTPPSRLNPRLGPDLETICLKCLEKQPVGRYASARELAEELERWLRGEPILARPVGAWSRAMKWACRNPVTASLTLATSLALILGVAGIAWQWRRAQHQSELAREATRELWESVPAQARAGRVAGEVGRREETLQALRAASRVRASAALRNEAIATLALFDLAPDVPEQPQVDPRSSIEFDPDLERYATYSAELRQIRVHQIREPRGTLGLACPNNPSRGPTFSPDGHFLAAVFLNEPFAGRPPMFSLAVWRLDTSNAVLRLEAKVVPSFAFDPTAPRLFVAEQDGVLRVIDLAQAIEAERWNDVPAGEMALAPDGRRLAIIRPDAAKPYEAGREVVVWNLTTRNSVTSVRLPAGIHALAWSPDGLIMALGCADREVHLWNVQTGEQRTLRGHAGLVHHVAFDAAGARLVSNGFDGTSRVWAMNTGQLLMVTQQGYGRRFSRDGQRLAWFRTHQSLGVWRVMPSPVFLASGALWGSAEVFQAQASPDGRWLAVAKDDGVRLLELPAGRERAFAAVPGTRAACFLPDGAALGVASTRGLSIHPITSGGDLEPGRDCLVPGLEPVRQLAMSDDGQKALVLQNQEARVVELGAAPRWLASFPVAASMARIAFSPDHRWAATFSGLARGAQVFEVASGKQVQAWTADGLSTVAFSHDGRWCAEAAFDAVTVRNTDSWATLYRVPRQSASDLPGLAAFSRDGRWLAITKTLRLIQLLDARTGAELASFQAPEAQMLTDLFFSADGQYLGALAADHTIQLWRLTELRRRLAELGLDWEEL